MPWLLPNRRLPERSGSYSRAFVLAALSLVVTLVAPHSVPALTLQEHARATLAKAYKPGVKPADLALLKPDLLLLADSLETAKEDSLAALCLERAGFATFRQGRLPEAQEIWTRGREVAKRTGLAPLEANLTNSLAMGFGAGGVYEKAIAMFEDVIRTRRRSKDVKGEGVAWSNMANCYSLMGLIPEALAATDSALRRDRISGNRTGLAANYNRLAGLMRDLGRTTEALAWSDSTLALMRRYQLQGLTTAYSRRGTLLYALGRNEEALASVDSAIAGSELAGDKYLALYDRVTRAELLQRLGRYDESLALLDAIESDVEALADENLSTQLAIPRGTALLNLGRLAEAETTLAAALARYEAYSGGQAKPMSQVGLFRQGGELYAALARCYLEQGREADAWAAVERGRAAVLRREMAQDAAPVTLPELQAWLGKSHAAFVLMNDPSLNPLAAFVVTGDALRSVSLSSIDPMVADARTALDLMASNADDARCRPPLERLSAAVVTPLLPLIDPATEHVFWALPSGLAGFPFEALPIPGSRQTLGDRYAISYVPSATALLRLDSRPAATAGMVVLADPVLESDGEASEFLVSQLRSLRETPLPHARIEARAIATADAKVLVGREASRGRLEEEIARKPGVVHLATHALLSPSQPQRSSLLLAGPDGMLTAALVESLSFESDLVTLSGCRTSGGFTYLGEGMFGLARSFLVAGARSVVSSLWDVDDRASRRFMTLFYDGLCEGQPRDESLKRARAQMAAEGFSHRDRSGFVLTGAGNLPVAALAGHPGPKRYPSPYLAVAAALAGVALVWILRRPKEAGRPATGSK